MADLCSSKGRQIRCDVTKAQVLTQVCAMLPQGRAWQTRAQDATDSTMTEFWSAISVTEADFYNRLCKAYEETFCATADLTLDQWNEDYGLPDECDSGAFSLCVKAALLGGNTCEYFVEIADLMGWVVTCNDISQTPVPNVGCWNLGCDNLPPKHEVKCSGSSLGYAALCSCIEFGPATNAPYCDLWEQGADRSGIRNCYIPGSTLGKSAMGPDCCWRTGYYSFDDTDTTADATGVSLCVGQSVSPDPIRVATGINEGALLCQDAGQGFLPGQLPSQIAGSDCQASSCTIEPYLGYAFQWQMELDLQASPAFIDSQWNMAGDCFHLGVDQLCKPPIIPLVCLINKIKPAHTNFTYRFKDH